MPGTTTVNLGDEGRFFIGADENGLGPRLGPMTVTAVMARVRPGCEAVISRRPRGGFRQRLGDSKGLMAHGDIGLGEAWCRELVAAGCGKPGASAGRPDDLVRAFSHDDMATLTTPCPRHVEGQCWSDEGEAFDESDEAQALRKAVRGDLTRLARRGVEIVSVRSAIVCTKRLNEAVDRGESRFVVDLHAMERLILSLRDQAGEDIAAECGKVGGYGQYGKVFGPLAGRLHVVMEEGRARSEYRFPGVGDIAFVRDCDAKNILVGMASLVGKYLRELLMGRIVEHYRRADPSLTTASGYHDPVTAKFVVATESLRKKRRVPSTCFERKKIGP